MRSVLVGPDAADVIAATALADVNTPVRYDWRIQKRRLKGEPLLIEPISLSESLNTVERVFFGTSADGTLALYDDTTGVYLGSIAASQYRTLRKHLAQSSDDAATPTVGQADIERVRQIGFNSDLIDRLEARIRVQGRVTLRRVRVGA